MIFTEDLKNNISLNNIDDIEKIITLIKEVKDIAVIGHIEPDGDSIGAQLAIVNALNENEWNADAINEGPFNNIFLKKNKKYFKRSIDKAYDLYIIVDTTNKDRIGKFKDTIDFEKSIVIDHHFTNPGFGKTNWVNENFISTSEMIFLLLYKMGIGLNNQKICQYLLDGIISDNGFFLHIRKNKHFSLLASYLLINKGADPKKSYNILFGDKNLSSKKLLALALQRIETLNHGKTLWTFLSDRDKERFHNPIEDSGGLFKQMLSIKGVEISIYFKVSRKKVDISFRSNDKIDVASLAKMFGGGGHRLASGAAIYGRFENIRNRVLKKAAEFVI
ncbi:MAG: bifunctional oligoribonuclease/PAP phosphatase NrnA [Spirochaetes bacterium]|nr:bifunctional oligoribonuclease/PAP phosphatase NrnA [Spirochaetota bacterium]